MSLSNLIEGATASDFKWVKNSKPFSRNRNAGTNAANALVDTRIQEYDRSFADLNRGLGDLALGGIDMNAVSAAGERGGAAFDAATGQLDRQQRVLGTGPVEGQDRRMSLRRIVSEVDARNRNIEGQEERRTMAQEAQADNYADLMGGAGQIYGNISDAERNRKGQYRQAQAANRSSWMGAVGALGGIALAAV